MEVALLIDSETGTTAQDWLRVAAHVDGTAVTALLRSDHLTGPGPSDQDCLDAWTACTAAATTTHTIGLGTLVSPITFRHPAILAKTVASASAFAGDRRLDVGIGIGWNTYEHRSVGLALPDTTTRYRMMVEYIAVLRGLWSGLPFSYDGEFFTAEDAQLHPVPARPPRIIVGKRGRQRSLELAVRTADEYNFVFQPPAACARIHQRLTEIADAFDQAPPRLSVMTDCVIGADARHINAQLADAATRYPMLRGATHSTLPAPYLATTPEALVDTIEAYANAGVDRMILKHPNPADLSSIDLLINSVLPQLNLKG